MLVHGLLAVLEAPCTLLVHLGEPSSLGTDSTGASRDRAHHASSRTGLYLSSVALSRGQLELLQDPLQWAWAPRAAFASGAGSMLAPLTQNLSRKDAPGAWQMLLSPGRAAEGSLALQQVTRSRPGGDGPTA